MSEHEDEHLSSRSFETGEIIGAHWSSSALANHLTGAISRIQALEAQLVSAQATMAEQEQRLQQLTPQQDIQQVVQQPQEQPLQQPAATAAPTSGPKVDPPKPFSGSTKDDLAVDTFIYQLNLYFASEPRILPHQRTLRAALLLQGDAATWLQSQHLDLAHVSWADFATTLRTTFRPPDFTVRARDALDRCTQTNSVPAYLKAFRRCVLRCEGLPQAEVLWRFVAGLKPETRAWVRMQDPATLEQAAAIAERYENTFKAAKAGNEQHERQQNPRRRDDSWGKNRAKNSRPGTSTQQPKQGPQGQGKAPKDFAGKCYQCGKYGHRRANCPQVAQLSSLLATTLQSALQAQNHGPTPKNE